MFLVLSWLIWNQVPWTLSDLVHLVKYSDQITLSLVRVVLVTTGLKDITLKVLNLSILFLMLFEKSQRVVIACKDFS